MHRTSVVHLASRSRVYKTLGLLFVLLTCVSLAPTNMICSVHNDSAEDQTLPPCECQMGSKIICKGDVGSLRTAILDVCGQCASSGELS